MPSSWCGWCVTGLVRPEFLADRAAGCSTCEEHRKNKEAIAKPSDCKKNPYHLCSAGTPCTCECHRVDSQLPRETVAPPKPKLALRKRTSNARKTVQG